MISVAVITTSRADYSIYRPLLKALDDAPGFDVGLLVSGSHLDQNQGLSVTEIEKDGYPIWARIAAEITDDSPFSISLSMGKTLKEFASFFIKNRPDLIFALGDRYEMFAAVSASVPFNIPVAHLHGGELTYGAQDDSFRHAITKLSHLHFACTKDYARRIAQMGEPAERIFNVGALSLDAIKTTPRLNKEYLCTKFDIKFDAPPLLVTLHSETRAQTSREVFATTFFDALGNFNMPVIITHPNNDAGGQIILGAARSFKNRAKNVHIVPNFGAAGYYSILGLCSAMVGNSSSGMLEASLFDLPVVNVGARQDGRLRSTNIIDTPMEKNALVAAIKKALSSDFKNKIVNTSCPFGDGSAATKIVEALMAFNFQDGSLLFKQFADLPRKDTSK